MGQNEDAVLDELKNRELAGVTFVRDYVQLLFDGPYLNAYVVPIVKTTQKTFTPGAPGYRDALCEQIGERVSDVCVKRGDKLVIGFDDGVTLKVSLKEADRSTLEAAMLQADSSRRWNVW